MAFTQQPFTFVFSGSFVDLYKLLDQLEGLTVQTPAGPASERTSADDRQTQPGPRKRRTGPARRQSESSRTDDHDHRDRLRLPAGESTLGGATPPAAERHRGAPTSGAIGGEPRPGGRKGDPMNEFLQSSSSDLLSRRLLPFVALARVSLVVASPIAVGGGSEVRRTVPVAGIAACASAREHPAGGGGPGEPHRGGLRDPGRRSLSEPGPHTRPLHAVARPAGGKERKLRRLLDFGPAARAPRIGGVLGRLGRLGLRRRAESPAPAPAPKKPAKPQAPLRRLGPVRARLDQPGQPATLTPYENLKLGQPLPSKQDVRFTFERVSERRQGRRLQAGRRADPARHGHLPAERLRMSDDRSGSRALRGTGIHRSQRQVVVYELKIVSITKKNA